jgi:prepilin-type N-terminal cleavage/methylation domain-containing protein/prepilin-type processing-associated H-X9-DG protein
MTCGRSHPVGVCSPADGFTLIELLVVIAVISVLMALALAALGRARTIACRVTCGSNLRQIAAAWHTYLSDNNQKFLQGFNAQHYFGGWQGDAEGAVQRPLNPYVGLPTEVQTPDGAGLFRCPVDQGEDYGPVAYLYFGNSYQTNLVLVGPDVLVAGKGMRKPVRELHSRINERLKDLRADRVCDPSRLLLVGDNNWITQWNPLDTATGRAWHGREDRYNLAFFDGHVALTEIHKGIYLDSDYRVQPFKELDSFTCEMQSQIVPRGEP